MGIKKVIKDNSWIMTIFWIIITAVITLIIGRLCDRIVPDNPVVIKSNSDTVKIVHSYDFGMLDDSIIQIQLKNKLKNIELVEQYESVVAKQLKKKSISNPIKIDASFPNAKGYSRRDATPYFSFNMSSLQNDFIEFELLFINDNMLKHIYCLSLKIFKKERDKSIYVLDENYDLNGAYNLIRIANTLPKGRYEFCVGFTFEKDKNDIYPKVYQLSKILNK